MSQTYIENAANHPDNLLLVGEVEDFGDVLDHAQVEVAEVGQCEVVVRQHPEAGADVVRDLRVILALFL